jgi:rhamnosyltransferase subunit B
MIAIGRQLRGLGWDVVISLAEPYARLAREVGLQAEPVISHEKFSQAIGNAGVWHPVRGPIQVFQVMVREFLQRHHQVIQRHHLPGQTVLVAHPLDLASRVVRDASPSVPLIGVHPQPVILRTVNQPPRLSPWWFEFSRPAWALQAGYAVMDHLIIDPIVRRPINQMRRTYGLAPVRRVMDQWWLAPDGIMAMYPDWFAPGTRDFHPRMIHCGFPLDDVDGGDFELPSNRPIVFTSGTAHQHCRDFFQLAIAACQRLNRPGLLLSSYPQNFPERLPDNIQARAYLSLRRLLPSCAGIVHHGGIGTTSQAMAAGIPQVIRPLAFDQFDNAERVERLRCGRWLRRPARLTEVLADVLDEASGSVDRAALRDISRRLQGPSGAVIAAEQIDQIANAHFHPQRTNSCDR